MGIVIGGIMLVLVVGAGYYGWQSFFAKVPVAEPVVEAPVVVDTRASTHPQP